ncbi:hypothetical protein BDW75DRAFT_221855 [Aspergillus navahoensis]
MPTAMAIVFSKFLGDAAILSAAKTVFSNSLRDSLDDGIPANKAARIIASGARSARDIVSGAWLTTMLAD